MIKEAIEIEKYLKNFNRENNWKISNAWQAIIHQARKQRREREQLTPKIKTMTTQSS